MKKRRKDDEFRQTKWAFVFLREEDGALEAVDRMAAGMEDEILHGTDDENHDVLECLTLMLNIARLSDPEAILPDRLMQLGNRAAAREVEADRLEIVDMLKDMDDPVAKATLNLVEMLKDRISPTSEKPLTEDDSEAAVDFVKELLGKLGGEASDD